METFLNLSLSAIILAGGKSSRMGQDKALLEVGGVPLLQKTATLIQAIADPIYIITPWSERYQSIVPPSCHLLRETLLSGDTQGPLVGFAQALTYIKTEWVLLLACDLPNLNAPEIEQWLSYLVRVSPAAIACLPRHAKGWEPLSGFYRRCCLKDLETFIDSGGRSFQGWLKNKWVEELPVSDSNSLFNCNTPADLLKINNTINHY
ncbi:molybdenum cofactor guanylyltransferase [Crocosphaera sp. XPORK-15E]|uniref:molybdenum cofactor guanylyltransferase n=1 Tax=Crocosphaera sp. XPORK-15E TaxID=3110247 RepID=UPI002B1F4800|nr:molybdenum cofactor guanylyltransferase [Crocosphaera sp. XPORK-15E]MEA5533673.1 molybdenum cofactor guanylyltransferase [Crocosphaera sp. XPORK-15E]